MFTGRDDRTYLFAGDQFVVFDSKRRWWSEPRSLHRTGTASRSSGSTPRSSATTARPTSSPGPVRPLLRRRLHRVDDRYPAPITPFWGNVVNNIARTGRVDAALVLQSPEVEGSPQWTHTYLFSGDQYVRYAGTDYATVDDGYPRAIGRAGAASRACAT